MLSILMLGLPWIVAGWYSFGLTADLGCKKFNDPHYPGGVLLRWFYSPCTSSWDLLDSFRIS